MTGLHSARGGVEGGVRLKPHPHVNEQALKDGPLAALGVESRAESGADHAPCR